MAHIFLDIYSMQHKGIIAELYIIRKIPFYHFAMDQEKILN